jgi:hypothetical protein
MITSTGVNEEGSYRMLLTNIPNDMDVFDLKSNGDIQYDFITDPSDPHLVVYRFSSNLSPTSIAGNMTASNIINNSAFTTFSIQSLGYASDPEIQIFPKTLTTTPALAISKNSYYSFNITPNSGYSFNLTSFNISVAKGGASNTRGWLLRSSLDNYTETIFVQNVTTQRPNWTNNAISLNSNYTNINYIVNFRIYVYAPATTTSLEFDDIGVTGFVFPTPTGGGDTCTYSGSGNWIMSCSDFCNITSNVALASGNNLTINGTGTIRLNANITNFNKGDVYGTDVNNRCNVYCIGGCLKK